jgi:hypothetical protein
VSCADNIMLLICRSVLIDVTRDLPSALEASKQLQLARKAWPPVNSGESGGLEAVMDEEMGFLD